MESVDAGALTVLAAELWGQYGGSSISQCRSFVILSLHPLLTNSTLTQIVQFSPHEMPSAPFAGTQTRLGPACLSGDSRSKPNSRRLLSKRTLNICQIHYYILRAPCWVRAHAHTHTHTHTHARTHARTYAHSHTHTRARARAQRHARKHVGMKECWKRLVLLPYSPLPRSSGCILPRRSSGYSLPPRSSGCSSTSCSTPLQWL